jgi:hypothetical protein
VILVRAHWLPLTLEDFYREAITGVAKPSKAMGSHSGSIKAEAGPSNRSKLVKPVAPPIVKREKSIKPKKEPLFLPTTLSATDYIDDEAIESDEDGDGESENEEDRAFIDDSYEGFARKRKSRDDRSRSKRVKREETSPSPTSTPKKERKPSHLDLQSITKLNPITKSVTKKASIETKPIDLGDSSSDDFDGIEAVEDELPAFKRSDDEQKRHLTQPSRHRFQRVESKVPESKDDQPGIAADMDLDINNDDDWNDRDFGPMDDDDYNMNTNDDHPMPAGAQYSTLATPACTMQQSQFGEGQPIEQSVSPLPIYNDANDEEPVDQSQIQFDRYDGDQANGIAHPNHKEAQAMDEDEDMSESDDEFGVMQYVRPQGVPPLRRIPAPSPAPVYPPRRTLPIANDRHMSQNDRMSDYDSDEYESQSDRRYHDEDRRDQSRKLPAIVERAVADK